MLGFVELTTRSWSLVIDVVADGDVEGVMACDGVSARIAIVLHFREGRWQAAPTIQRPGQICAGSGPIMAAQPQTLGSGGEPVDDYTLGWLRDRWLTADVLAVGAGETRRVSLLRVYARDSGSQS